MINVIGSDAYVKNCPFENRWDLDVSEEQAEKIASAVQEGCINIRCVQGKFIEHEGKKIWFGDNLGRIAEGLSKGRIQLQQEEATKTLSEGRSWTNIPTREAKGWKDIFVTYVYSEDLPSPEFSKQAENNPSRVLYEAGAIFPGQYVGLTKNLRLVIGDHPVVVAKCILGEEVKEI